MECRIKPRRAGQSRAVPGLLHSVGRAAGPDYLSEVFPAVDIANSVHALIKGEAHGGEASGVLPQSKKTRGEGFSTKTIDTKIADH